MTITNKRDFIFLSLLILTSSVFLIAGKFLYASIERHSRPLNLTASTLYPTPKELGDFSLLSLEKDKVQSFSSNDLQKKWHLIFMGYTSCPHICPTEMYNLSQLYQKLPYELQEITQVVMVTTDPLKDTPEVLEEYVKKYHSDFIGLSGSKKQIADFAREFSMPFLPSAETDKNKPYEVNHSASIYLTNPDGELHAVFSTPHNVSKMHTDLLQIMSL